MNYERSHAKNGQSWLQTFSERFDTLLVYWGTGPRVIDLSIYGEIASSAIAREFKGMVVKMW